MPKYESIPAVLESDEESPTMIPRSDDEQQRSKRRLQGIIGGVAVLSTLLVVIAMKSSATTATVPLLANSNSAASCTLAECYASNCNHKVAPFTCLFHNGGPHGGCSPTPWTEATCTTQCDLSHCADLAIPDDTESCDRPCDETVCAGERVCDALPAPYQCTSGAAKFGCSKGKLEWTLRTSDTTCNACCDTRTCEE
mmetsp:Transcript_28503/g.52629  ORF Transcript_28503/g.52629 Transcript_28503/m.52629 type:complete len:197 (-) Transcript_28503:140-730(-)